MASWIMGVAVLLAALSGAKAQESNVTCMASYSWANNQLHQDPCTVASWLEGVCYSNGWVIPALGTGNVYLGPTATQSQPCECNTVVYSLMSACGACQGASFVSWSEWIVNCTTSGSGYPEEIPSGTEVPGWAYLDLPTGYWNATAAQADLAAPASTAPGSMQSTQSAMPAPSSSPSVAASSTKNSHAGAIAGGVVGGVAGVAIVSLLIVVFLRRRAKNARQLQGGQPTPSWHNPVVQTQYIVNGVPQPYPEGAQTKLYDPADPSTFPRSPEPSVVYTTYTAAPLSPVSGEYSSLSRPGQYTGAPEV
ncbi:hypothetical protein BV22DRAFT_1029106 [Leucogyrophana mollusca]|uniref:Uncharacterized protein n=1 Tax=Leucogyrophana mollusca TaxID=85980 RepID=A0ACB8BWT6_9AGAM|nr:hypothetical protein BV22DRAFT_1029106 [Leucogyrophana mollusca]